MHFSKLIVAALLALATPSVVFGDEECVNLTDSKFSLKNGGKQKKCKGWAKKNGKGKNKCNKKIKTDGPFKNLRVKEVCPVDCEECPDEPDPTAAPTNSPTASPTSSPTASPTPSPTNSPTPSPTTSNTAEPTTVTSTSTSTETTAPPTIDGFDCNDSSDTFAYDGDASYSCAQLAAQGNQGRRNRCDGRGRFADEQVLLNEKCPGTCCVECGAGNGYPNCAV